jgi:hypothetical protein
VKNELNTLRLDAVKISSEGISTPCNRNITEEWSSDIKAGGKSYQDTRSQIEQTDPIRPILGTLPRGDVLMDMSVLADARIIIESQIKWHDCGTDMISLQDIFVC